MNLLKRIWYRFLAAEARSEPGKGGPIPALPGEPEDINPHGEVPNAGQDPHTWKSHGGGRH